VLKVFPVRLCLSKSWYWSQRLMLLRARIGFPLMLTVLVSFLRTARLSMCSRAALQLEILALRHQLLPQLAHSRGRLM